MTRTPVTVTPSVRSFALDRVAHVLGRGDTEVQVAGRRHDYWVLRCVCNGSRPSLLVKLAGPDCPYPVDFTRTAAVTAQAAEAGVPVAHVLASDDTYAAGPWRYAVQEVVAGREWCDVRPGLSASGALTAYAQLADVLVALSSVSFPAFGPLGGDGLPTSDLDLLSALELRAASAIADQERASAFVDLLRREQALFSDSSGAATLCHDDLHHRNVLFDGAGEDVVLTAVLDWDKAWSGSQESDLARMALWDDMTGAGFWSTLRRRREPAHGEQERRPIYQLLWCLEYDVATPRHRRETERLARRLGVRL